MNPLYALIAVGLDAARIAFSKSKIKETAAAVVVGVVGIGLLLAPSAVGQDTSSRSFLSPYINSIEVHNHGSAGFSISLDVGAGWEAFGGSGFCYLDPDEDEWCFTDSSMESPIYRWPDSVYLANPPQGTSTESYDFVVSANVGTLGFPDGTSVSSDGLDIDVTVFIEVTDGSVSAIYCWVSYPSTYYGPFRRESYYPYLLYMGNWYANGFWYND